MMTSCGHTHTMEQRALAIRERLSALEAEGAHTTSVQLDNVRKFTEVMGLIDPEWARDTRLKVQLTDWVKKSAFTFGEKNKSKANKVGGDMGQLIAVRRRPTTRSTMVKSQECTRMIKSYTGADC